MKKKPFKLKLVEYIHRPYGLFFVALETQNSHNLSIVGFSNEKKKPGSEYLSRQFGPKHSQTRKLTIFSKNSMHLYTYYCITKHRNTRKKLEFTFRIKKKNRVFT